MAQRGGACVRQGWIRSRIQPEEYRGGGEEGTRVTGGTDVRGGLGVTWGAPPASQLSGADRKLPRELKWEMAASDSSDC